MAEKIDPNVNQLPDPAAFASDGPPKKFKKRRGLEDPGGLTMNSLMDIMTIILVFLLKSYATDPVQLKQSPDLKPPFSTAQIKPSESTVITVTLSDIVVDDLEGSVRLDGKGTVAAKHLTSSAFLIDPLFATLNKVVDHQKRVYQRRKDKKFEGIVTIIADRNVPFKLLSQVMYTAGQATFGKFKFMVVKGG